MSPKVKSLFKGLKYISQIFVYKEQEMEIGHPTDVRHIAHIGFASDSIHAPSWMSQFKSASDITPASLNGFTSASLNDFDYKQPRRWQSVSSSTNSIDGLRPDLPKPSKKKKRKKVIASSSVTSICSSSSSFSAASKELVETPKHLPVACEEVIPEMPNQLQAVISEPVCV
ncbi:CRIB domain-containing protein RIC10-like isoform X2 [Phalaenopsis equestris]|nr:CRIB domain-containing protein RIC10-like isoform X2 [Phalaenopsis equestris]